ncbi:MAG: transporter substrate-binding domain-containing protein [Burkholderiales bacterium]|nr:transporter substrate-binding domain-containing protein [Burkholderiales bacterium]
MTAFSQFFAIGLSLGALSMPSYAGTAVSKVVYPMGEIPNDTRFNDVIEILCLALEKTRARYGDYECLPSSGVMPKKRFLQELEQSNHEINVIWNPTSEEMERRFAPIRISLRKDLLGYRVALILRQNQAKIDSVKTRQDLKKLSFGQGAGWIDNVIYQAHDINVVQAQYSQLIKMLSAKRFDMFPRGVGEILAEYESNAKDNPDVVIEKNLLIYYPFPYYFFFNREDKAIRERVEAGLRMMQKDGSFDAIFNKYHQSSIEKLNLKERRIIRLDNPLLPKNTPPDALRSWSVK